MTVLSIPFIFRKDGGCRGMIKKGSVSSASTLLVQMCFFKKVREQVVSVAAKQLLNGESYDSFTLRETDSSMDSDSDYCPTQK